MEQWLSQNQGALIAAVISSSIAGLFTWLLMRSGQSHTIRDQSSQIATLERQIRSAQEKHTASTAKLTSNEKQLKGKLAATEKQMVELKSIAKKYEDVRAKLQNSFVIKTYQQPVILIGPRDVGKTSLLLQWHSPWDNTKEIPATQAHKTAVVPVYDFIQSLVEPHFADTDLLVSTKTHLVLKVHDFRGEPTAQAEIRDTIIEETQNLRYQTGRNLGVVLILMLDAEEAHSGITDKTHEYYNGDLFRELRQLVSANDVYIERLILVFNKFDKLREHYPSDRDDASLLNLCLDKFSSIYRVLRRACSNERVCEVLTILDRENMRLNNRGAPIVMGEASRAFVTAFAGEEAAKKVAGQPATTGAAARFL